MIDRLNQDVPQSLSRNTGLVQVRRDREISIPSLDSDREMAIRCADWKMLQKRLTAATALPKDYSNLVSALFAIGISAFLYLIPLAFTKDIPSWALWAYGAFAATFSLCGIFAFFLSRDYRKIRKTIITDLLDDVRDIEGRFTLGPTPGRQSINASEHELPTGDRP